MRAILPGTREHLLRVITSRIRSREQLLHSARTTRCTHGHQTPLSLGLWGVACETNNRAGCIVEPYNASGQPNFNFVKKLVKVVTFMCARGPAPHVARGRKHCKCMASLYKHMGKLQRAVTLILRRESKFLKVKSLHLIHSARRYKN